MNPIRNKKDLEEIPDNIKRNLDIIPVSFLDDVIKNALITKPKSIQNIESPITSQMNEKTSNEVGTAH